MQTGAMNRSPVTLFLMKSSFKLLPALLLSLGLSGAIAQESGLARIKEQELERVREQISELKQRIDRRTEERDRVTRELQQVEMEISAKRVYLRELQSQQQYAEQRISALDADLSRQLERLESQVSELSRQVSSAYMSGRQERIRLILSQYDPATLGRMLTYHRYLSGYRAGSIQQVNTDIAELKSIRNELQAEQQNLQRIVANRQAELAILTDRQAERQTLLAEVKAKLAEEGDEIARLTEQEEDLAQLIAELTSILSDYPITSEEPFDAHKGNLTWPVAGQLSHDFGQPRAAGLNWKGVVINADRGREVRSIYHGRIAFADWLSGMGLLVIVDHGDGYMSLYGYNETTLKQAGDWVAPGDVIATVGDSGGQLEPALYFEVRKGTQPLNPHRWISRTPQSP